MKAEFKDRLMSIVIIPACLAIALVPFSLLIGWNLASLFLFWFVLVPMLAIYLPTKISKNKNHLFESLAGLIFFYAIVVFMIYEHFNTDYFQVMMLSCGINIVLIVVVTFLKRPRIQINS